jgi:hypothetical protein
MNFITSFFSPDWSRTEALLSVQLKWIYFDGIGLPENTRRYSRGRMKTEILMSKWQYPCQTHAKTPDNYN